MSDRGTAIVWFRRDLRLTDNPALSAACEQRAPRGCAVRARPRGRRRVGARRPPAAGGCTTASRDSTLRCAPAAGGWSCAAAVRSTRCATSRARRGAGRGVLEPPLRAGARRARHAHQGGAARGRARAARASTPRCCTSPGRSAPARASPTACSRRSGETCAARLDALPRPLPAPPAVPRAAVAAREPRARRTGLLPRIRWDAGLHEAWTPGEAGALAQLEAFRRRRARALRRRPQPPGPAGDLAPLAAPALRRDRPAPVPRGGAQRGRRASGGAGLGRQLRARDSAGASSPTTCCTTSRTRPTRRSTRASTLPLGARATRWLEAWQRGRTGYPIVDAGMRELWHTGWMHNRVRMIVASLLTKNLRLPWLEGARWFWDTLVDADLANNTLGWQWTAGCGADAAPFFRVFNPMLQGERFDPERRLRAPLGAGTARGCRTAWIHARGRRPAAVLAAAGVRARARLPAARRGLPRQPGGRARRLRPHQGTRRRHRHAAPLNPHR